jgi:hypothetical protein
VIKVGGRMFAFVPLSGWFRVVNLKCDPAHKPRGRGSVFHTRSFEKRGRDSSLT